MSGGFEEGKEYSLEDSSDWAAIVPQAGCVMEVDLKSTDGSIGYSAWAAFFIRAVSNELAGSHVQEVYYMGREDEEEGAARAKSFGQGTRQIHLCLSKPCVVIGPMDAIHVTKFRLWHVIGFSADYVVEDIDKKLKKWLKEQDDLAKPQRRTRATPKVGPAEKKKPKDKGKGTGGEKDTKPGRRAAKKKDSDAMNAERSCRRS